jgi:energy-coupling factor transport system permease protein
MYDITLGGYIPASTIIHRMNAVSKLVCFVFLLIIVFGAEHATSLTCAASIVFLCVALSGVGLRTWLWGIRRFWFMLVLVFLVNALFHRTGKLLYVQDLELPFTSDGMHNGAILTFKLLLGILLSLCFTFTTKISEIAKSFEFILRPLEKLHLRVHEWGLILYLALRFIPDFQQEIQRIAEAQMCRGIYFKQKNIIQRAKSFLAILMPALFATMRRSDSLVITMANRGYRPGESRININFYWGRIDYSALFLVFMIFIVFLLDNS